MISVLLIWFYILITCLPLGYISLACLVKNHDLYFKKKNILPEDYVMFGIMLVTIYSEFFSIFAGVSVVANIILLIASITSFIIIILKKQKNIIPLSFNKNTLIWILFAIIILTIIMAIGTSRGYFHYDSDLYHGQAIRWIEEMKCVKGLGNLHTRLGYNSASFALCALYSLHFITGQSFHAVAGLLVLITSLSCLRIIHIFKDKNILVSDFARIAGLYYIYNIYDEMVSPASDFFVMLYFIYIVIRLLDMSELDEVNADTLAIPALMSVFLITLKLSAAGMIICVLAPLILLIRDKNYKRILLYAGLSILIVLPFLIRNYILTGWLIFPYTKIDLFNPEWKVPLDIAQIDADFIVAYGRGYTEYQFAQLSISEWFPHWIKDLSKTELILFLSSVISLPILLVSSLLQKKKHILHITELSISITFLMWFFSSPLVRYGQGFLIMLPAVLIGDVICYIFNKANKPKWILISAVSIFLIFISYKTVMTSLYIKDIACTGYWITQQDYNKYETNEYYVQNEIIYLPCEGNRTGYYAFPSATTEPKIELLGDSLEDGFKYIGTK